MIQEAFWINSQTTPLYKNHLFDSWQARNSLPFFSPSAEAPDSRNLGEGC